MKNKLEYMIETRIKERNAIAYEQTVEHSVKRSERIAQLNKEIEQLTDVSKLEDLPVVSSIRKSIMDTSIELYRKSNKE